MRWGVVAIVIAVGAVIVPGAAAQTPTRDSVTGSAGTGMGRGFSLFTFDVSSGPSGENPTGTVKIDSFFGPIGPLDVSCLTVSANKAAMILPAPTPTSSIAGLVVAVQDDGPGQDRIDFHTVAELPADCPVPSEVLNGTVSGDITITDAPRRPTLQQAIKMCVFERVAIGQHAFREKYGVGRFHLFAMLRCIRQKAPTGIEPV